MGITRITGIASGMDTESIVQQLVAGHTKKKDELWKQKKSLEYKQDAWKDMNKDIYGLYTNLANYRLQSTYQTNQKYSSNEDVATIGNDSKVTGQNLLEVKQIATHTYLTCGSAAPEPHIKDTLSVKVGGSVEQELNITPDMSMSDIAKRLTQMGLSANYDKNNSRMFVTSLETGKDSNFEITGNAATLSALGLGPAAAKMEGQDAIINLNGADFTSDSNNFSINGMNIAVSSVGSTTLGTKTNDTIYDTVKNFIQGYNELIKKIDTSYNTNNNNYKPLTEDEKYSLSDKQIEDWEDKIKEGSLYKDSNLSNISNILKDTMSSSVDGKYLSSFGITLGNYFTTEKEERGVYNIDEDKLKSAINEDPDKVVNFFSKLAAKMYEKLGNEMRSSSLRSVYSAYDDKQLKKDIENYNDRIAEMEDKITSIEDKYYDKFAKMETLLSSIQNQNNYLTNFFG